MVTIEQQNGNEQKPLNIWKSVWLHPRQTARYLYENKTVKFALIFAMISGVFNTLDQASGNDVGDSMSIGIILLLSLLLGPIGGLISLYVGGGVFHLLSKMFRGSGDFRATMMAITVSNVILIMLGVLWIPDLLIIGNGMFISNIEFSVLQAIWLIISLVITAVVAVWSVVALVAALAELQELAIWKAVLVVLIPITVITIIIVSIAAMILFATF
ncbi:YIP1 family protein [Sporosarcina sp. OR05]|uniref:YIP1 family protein n=1 Tax=Sporosarcina sp. OR05 TaxID=2969819 RepID=UPI00352AE022